MSRYKNSIVLSLLLVSLPTLASFSLFVSVSPTNEIPDMRPTIKSQGNKVVINVPYVEGEQKYWLIISDKKLPKHKQNFREVIWSANAVHSGIMLIAPLGNQFQQQRDKLTIKDEKPEIQIVLTRTLAMHSYVYYDYPKPVYDGGTYYTIDIPSFLQKHISQK